MVKDLTFITGNPNKAELLKKHLKVPLLHQKLDLTEIQSLDVEEVVKHKAIEAYSLVQKPVLVEDTSLRFHALGGLPGPYIKWFTQELGLENLCKILDPFENRKATATVCFGLYDGEHLQIFKEYTEGSIANVPAGTKGFGWDALFIHEGDTKTRAEMDEDEYHQTSSRRTAVEQVAEYLINK